MNRLLAIMLLAVSGSALALEPPTWSDYNGALGGVTIENTTNASAYQDDSINVDASDRSQRPAHSAAPVILTTCQSGMSAQVQNGGIAVGGTESFCRLIDLSNMHLESMLRSSSADEMNYHHQMKEKYLKQASDMAVSTAHFEAVEEKVTSVAKTGLGLGVLMWLIILI